MLVALALLTGCLLSGTFVIVISIEKVDFTTRTGFYYYHIDLSEEQDWLDHKDDIKDIDLVGFELWITNHEDVARTFSVYVDDDASLPDSNSSLTDVKSNATLVLDEFELDAGPNKQMRVTYGQSFKYLKNVETLKSLVEKGTFDYFGVSSGGTASGYTIDSARVIITFTAGK